MKRASWFFACGATCVALLLAIASASAAEPTYFDSAGCRLRYVVEGEGEPVVLVHGFSADIGMQWAGPGVIRALRDDFRVVALDNRGHGRSDKPHDPDQYGLEMVEDIVRLMDHLEIERAHVVGYSLGAFITCKLLSVYPERLISATLGGAGWGREEDPRDAVMTELAESLEAGKGMAPLFRALTPVGKPVPTDEQLAGLGQMAMLINDPLALAACIRGRNELKVPEATLRASRVPTLALIGEIDPLKSTVDPLVGVLPGLEVVVIPGADHMNAFGRTQFRDSLKEFLEAHRLSTVAVGAGK